MGACAISRLRHGGRGNGYYRRQDVYAEILPLHLYNVVSQRAHTNISTPTMPTTNLLVTIAGSK
eukprot:2611240-Pleurochrysis_carterae.AAC.1